jgi:hypothetical protein
MSLPLREAEQRQWHNRPRRGELRTALHHHGSKRSIQLTEYSTRYRKMLNPAMDMRSATNGRTTPV